MRRSVCQLPLAEARYSSILCGLVFLVAIPGCLVLSHAIESCIDLVSSKRSQPQGTQNSKREDLFTSCRWQRLVILLFV
jgi:hypothetical protein